MSKKEQFDENDYINLFKEILEYFKTANNINVMFLEFMNTVSSLTFSNILMLEWFSKKCPTELYNFDYNINLLKNDGFNIINEDFCEEFRKRYIT